MSVPKSGQVVLLGEKDKIMPCQQPLITAFEPSKVELEEQKKKIIFSFLIHKLARDNPEMRHNKCQITSRSEETEKRKGSMKGSAN